MPRAGNSGWGCCTSLRKLEVRAALCVLGVGRDPDPIKEGGGLVPRGDSS